MNIINLKQYYPFCKEDIFVEVSDEIVEAFLLDKRAEAAEIARCSGIRRFIPSIVTMESKMPPSAGRSHRRRTT